MLHINGASWTHDELTDGLLRHNLVLAVVSPCLRDEKVEPAGKHEEGDNEEYSHMHQDERVHERRVVVHVVLEELGVRKRPYHDDGWSSQVFENDWPSGVKLPVIAGQNSAVNIPSELVALLRKYSQQEGISQEVAP